MSSQPLFSESERRVLHLYDRLEQLQLQLALLKARHNQACDGELRQDAHQHDAQDQLLESRATYSLRQHAAESVLAAPPMLKAVHHAADASPVESELASHAHQRDAAASITSAQGSILQEARSTLADVQAQGFSLARQNAKLAAAVLDLAESIRGHSQPGPEALASNEVTRLEQELAASRRKWRLIKGAAAGIVAGSGVDWVREAALRDMVLEPAD